MCARITIIHSMDEIAEYFDVNLIQIPDDAAPLTPRYNVAPTDPMLAITQSAGGREAVLQGGEREGTFEAGRLISPSASEGAGRISDSSPLGEAGRGSEGAGRISDSTPSGEAGRGSEGAGERIRKLQTMYWGLVPYWAESKSVGSKMINARSETLEEKSAYKRLIGRKRCIIAADGFYEWINEGKAKKPLHFELIGKPLFGLAGLWDTWRQPDGSFLRSCTVITVPANTLMAPIHDRMPAILDPADYEVWLDVTQPDPSKALAALKPFDERRMRAYPVAPIVNKPGVENPACIVPWEDAGAPAIQTGLGL